LLQVWLASVGIIGRDGMYSSLLRYGRERDVASMNKEEIKENVKKFLNRLLGLNLQQQQIVFGCAAPIHCLARSRLCGSNAVCDVAAGFRVFGAPSRLDRTGNGLSWSC
jgi:hypothetical protein